MIRRSLILLLSGMLALSSCLSDGPVGGEDGDGVPAVIMFDPVPSATSGPKTRAGEGYGGHDPSDPELKPGTPDDTQATGHPHDSAISHIRVILYRSDSGVWAAEYDCPVPTSEPIELRVITGTYDVVLITNEKSDETHAGQPYLTRFLSDRTNYNLLSKLKNAVMHSETFGKWTSGTNSGQWKNIPMFTIEHGVRIVGNHHIINQGGTEFKDTAWTPYITRTGVRLSLAITLSPGQFADWQTVGSGATATRNITIGNVPTASHLHHEAGFNGEGNRESAARVYTARSGNAPVAGADGYYWFDDTGSEPVYRVRFDRIIVPELMLSGANTASKALVLSMDLGGNDPLAGPIGMAHAGTSATGYNLPRNTWLHLDVAVAETKLRVNPVVLDWNNANTVPPGATPPSTPKTNWLKTESDPVEVFGFGSTKVFRATTNHSSGVIGVEKRTASPAWITAVAVSGTTTGSDGITSANIEVTAAANTTGADRSGVIYLTTGDEGMLRVSVWQRPAVAYAAPGVIGYKADGTLTLRGSREFLDTPLVGPDGRALATGLPLEDETVHAAYFKWGSLVALSSDMSDVDTAGTWFDADDIIAAPAETGGVAAARAALGGQTNLTAWLNKAAIPARAGSWNDAANDPRKTWEPDVANGYGDPCRYYFGGTWHVPSIGPVGWYPNGGGPFGATNIDPVTWPLAGGADLKEWGENNLPIMGAVGGRNGIEDWSMFLPSIGIRIWNSGTISSWIGINGGSYWSASISNQPLRLAFNRTSVTPNLTASAEFGYGVRCVK